MDASELASEQVEALMKDPSPEKVALSTALALWQIVKVLNRIADAMPQQPEI